MKSLLLVNPRCRVPTYFSLEVMESLGLGRAVSIADLPIATVAALVPDDFSVALCDGNLGEVPLDHPAEFVGLTGKNIQFGPRAELADAFRRRGKTVIIGGCFASLSPEQVRPHCDILVTGELESLAPELFSDLRRGRWRDHYQGPHADLAASPVPRWELYPNDRAATGSLQVSRGCPNDCEFCSVIRYLGRRQRYKSSGQVVAELEALARHGYRLAFLADDNLTGHPGRAKEILARIAEWNRARADDRLVFITQLSVEVTEDEEMLRLLTDAGVQFVFVGLETPNRDSLAAAGKHHNLPLDLGEAVRRFVAHGIMVMAGMVVGFDPDDAGIFGQHAAFAAGLPAPVFYTETLVAMEGTPLHERLSREGRLVGDFQWYGDRVGAVQWDTNIRPKQMTREALIQGMLWLVNRLYAPDAFGERVCAAVRLFGRDYLPEHLRRPGLAGPVRPLDWALVRLARRFMTLGPAEERQWREIGRAIAERPATAPLVMKQLGIYLQIRHMMDVMKIWDPAAAASPSPGTALPVRGRNDSHAPRRRKRP
jgi:hypothetical protein